MNWPQAPAPNPHGQLTVLSAPEVVIQEWIDGQPFSIKCHIDEDQAFSVSFRAEQVLDNARLPKNHVGLVADQILNEDWRMVSLRNYTDFFTQGIPDSSLIIYGTVYGQHSDYGPIGARGADYAQGVRFAVIDVGIFRPGKVDQLMDWQTLDRFTAHLSFEIVPLYYQGVPDVDIFNQHMSSLSQVAAQNHMSAMESAGLVIKVNPPQVVDASQDFSSRWQMTDWSPIKAGIGI